MQQDGERIMNRAAELAAIVRAAHRRLFFCERHEIRRATPETCELCILERIAAGRGRQVTYQSIAQIMAGPTALRF